MSPRPAPLDNAVRFAVAGLMLGTIISGVSGRTDPETGRVRVFNIGTTRMVRTIGLDPLITISAIPTRVTWEGFEKDAVALQRFLRIYWPRTYERILDSFDVIYSAASAGPLGYQPAWTQWIRDAIVEEGIGFCETGGSGSFGGQKEFTGWIGTPVEEIMPVELIHSEGEEPCGALQPKIVTLRILKPEDPFLSSLPMETIPKAPFQWINQGGIKQEASTIIVREHFPDWPVCAHMEVEKGKVVGWLPFVYTIGGYFGNFAYWEYFADFLINLMYFGAEVDMPEDPVQIHRIRTVIQEFDAKRQFLIDIIEFANRFGASTASLERLVGESSGYEALIRGLYVEQRYEETWDVAEEAQAKLDELQIKAMKIKSNALLWVYAIEWISVTSTAIVAGSILWILMVRRRVYREVKRTRLARA